VQNDVNYLINKTTYPEKLSTVFKKPWKKGTILQVSKSFTQK